MCADLPEGLTRELLRERVTLIRPGVVLYREVAGMTVETMSTMLEKIMELTGGLETYHLVVDLNEATRPDPDTREELVRLLNSDGRLGRITIVVGINTVLRVGLRFVLAGITGKDITVVRTMADAEREIDGVRD